MLILSVLTAALLLRGAASQCVSNCGCSALPGSCCLTVWENQPPGQIGVDDSTATTARLMNYSEPRYFFFGQNANPDNSSIVLDSFYINALNATVSTLRSLDREHFGEDSCITLLVIVRENSGVNPFIFPIVIKVLDINDNSPVFSAPFFTISIPETHVDADSGEVSRVECTSQMVSMLTATDADEGDNAVVTYSVAPEGDQSSLFVVEDPSVPCVMNAPGVDLDIDVPPSVYSFTLVATSGTLQAKVIVIYALTDVNDNLPSFDSESYTISVREDQQPGSEIFQFKAEDPDLGDKLCYSISGDGTFKMNESTGSLMLTSSPDAETGSTVNLVVTATSKRIDLTYDYASANVHIDIIDVNEKATIHFGVFMTPPVTQITENAMQTVITDFVIEDGDREPGNRANNTLAVIGDSMHMFKMLEVPSPAQSVWLLQQVKPVDFEKNRTIQIHIQSTEFGEPVIQQVFLYNLTVLDVNDNRPYLSCNQVSIPEDKEGTSSNRQIVDLSQYVFDHDNNSSNGIIGSYYLVSVTAITTTEDLTNHFAGTLDETTGVVSTGSLDISLDREVLGDILIFRVLLTDMGDPPLFQEVKFNVTLMDVNDNPPVFELPRYTFNISENQPSSTHVGRVHASDLDTSKNGAVTYSILEADSLFTIDELTGDLRSVAMFDRESRNTYQITVQARDGGNPSLTAEDVAVTIVILDENDEIPFFIRYQEDVDMFTVDTSFTIDTSFSAGDEIGIVIATDNDEFPNNWILYALDSPSPIFKIQDSSVGIITLGQAITEAHVGSYQLNISAFNPGQESQRDTIAVTVVINTVNSFTHWPASIVGGAASFTVLVIVVVFLLMYVCYKNRHHERCKEKVNSDKAQKTILKIVASNGQQSCSRVTFSEYVQETHYNHEGVVMDTHNVIRKESETKFNKDMGDQKQGHTYQPGQHLDLDVDQELEMDDASASVGRTSVPYHHLLPPHSPHMPTLQVVVTRGVEEEMSSDGHTFVESEESEEALIVNTTLYQHHHRHHHSDIQRDRPFTHSHLYSHFPGMSRGRPGKSTLEQLHAHNLAQLTECDQQQQLQGPPLGSRDEHSHSPSQTSVQTQLLQLDCESTQSPLSCVPTPSPLDQASIQTQSTPSDSQPTEHSGILTPPPLGQASIPTQSQTPNSSCDPTPPALGQTSILLSTSTQTPHSCVQTPSVLGQISVATQSTQSQSHFQGPEAEGRRTHRISSVGVWSETSTELDKAMMFDTDSEPEVISLTVMTTISEETAA